ncbi:MAG: DUF2142 domain-containing protein [Chloroflexota bacterium]
MGATIDGSRAAMDVDVTAAAHQALPANKPAARSHLAGLVFFALLSLLLLGIVLWTGYSTAVNRRYEALNNTSGEILAGGSVGQTFVARYNNLDSVDVRIGTYGRQADPSRATLVLHLRADPSSQTDIATATLPPSVVLVENGWYRFTFAPIGNSKGKPYYVQVDSPGGRVDNALTLYWFKPNPRGDPYRNGTAYLNGQQVKADLTFGTGYSASPVEVWLSMLGEALANSSAIVISLLLTAALAGIMWALSLLPRMVRDPVKIRRSLLRWSLPLVLAVGFVNGLLYMLVVPPWQGPDEYTHFAYAALLDSHDLDDRKVEALDLAGKDRDTALIDAVNASGNRHDFTRRFAGSVAPGEPTRVGPFIFQQTRQPATYYWLCAAALRIARAVGIPADPVANPEAALMVMRFVSLLLSMVVVALAWLSALFLWRNGNQWLQLLLPLTVALLPMHTFIATVVNNDILAEVAVSALFASLAALLRWPNGLRGVCIAALSAAITIATVATKSTATAAALPLLAGGLLIWAVLLFRQWRANRAESLTPQRKNRTALLYLLLVFAIVAIPLRAFQQDAEHAAGWFTGYDPIQRAARVESATAHNGTHAIELGGSGPTTAVQNLLPPLFHPSLDVVFTGYARLAPGQTARNVTARLVVVDIDREAAVGEAQLVTAGEWVPIRAAGRVNESAGRVTLRLSVMGGPAPVQFDELALSIQGVNGPWSDPIYKPVVVDSSAENPPITLREPLDKIVPGEIRAMLDVVANGQAFDKIALWRDYAYQQYRSYWGNFGWLTMYLPPIFYTLLDLLVLLSLIGLITLAIRRRNQPNNTLTWLGVVCLATLAATILISFAKQMMLMAYTGLPAYPQGRYLFVLIIPTAWLLLTGLSEIRHLIHSRFPRQSATTSTLQSIAAPLYATILVFFTTYSLLALILPFYYG